MRLLLGLLLLLLASGLRPASGQSVLPVPIALEVRFGGGIPTGDLANRSPGPEAEFGASLAGVVAVSLSSRIALFGGYGRTDFACGRCAEQGLDDRVVDEGAEAGVQLTLPGPFGRAESWLRAGGVYRQIRFGGTQGDLASEPAVGLQVGGGVALPILPRIWITPGVHFRAFSAELDLGGLPSESIDVAHFTVDLGLVFRP